MRMHSDMFRFQYHRVCYLMWWEFFWWSKNFPASIPIRLLLHTLWSKKILNELRIFKWGKILKIHSNKEEGFIINQKRTSFRKLHTTLLNLKNPQRRGQDLNLQEKKGCVERIAPRCTLSQNGYGNRMMAQNGYIPMALSNWSIGMQPFCAINLLP